MMLFRVWMLNVGDQFSGEKSVETFSFQPTRAN
jgi:hypothetical protein